MFGSGGAVDGCAPGFLPAGRAEFVCSKGEIVPEVDTTKAFVILMAGAALAAFIVYAYDAYLAPVINSALTR